MKNKLLTLLLAVSALFATSLGAQTIVGERSVSLSYSNAGNFVLNLPGYAFDYERDSEERSLFLNLPITQWSDVGVVYSYQTTDLPLDFYPSAVDINVDTKTHFVGLFGSFYFPRLTTPVADQPTYTERNLFTPYITVGAGHAFTEASLTVRNLWCDRGDVFRASNDFSTWIGFSRIGVIVGNDWFQVDPYFQYNVIERSVNDSWKVGVNLDATVSKHFAVYVGYARLYETILHEDITSEADVFTGGIRFLF